MRNPDFRKLIERWAGMTLEELYAEVEVIRRVNEIN